MNHKARLRLNLEWILTENEHRVLKLHTNLKPARNTDGEHLSNEAMQHYHENEDTNGEITIDTDRYKQKPPV